MAGSNHGFDKGARAVRFLKALFLLVLVAALAAGSAGWWWLHHPMRLSQTPLDLDIEPGTRPRAVAQAVRAAGVDVDANLLYWWFRLSGEDRQIKAGSYELTVGITPERLLDKLARGEESLRAVTLVEGWTFHQMRAALAHGDQLRQDTAKLSDGDLMKALGRPNLQPEGHFFPDTYTYSKGSSDLAVLKRAMRAMDRRLAQAWAQRGPDLAIKTPEEALVLASIVEKETGKPADRPLVSAVFQNRLRLGMPLQTDPTVIYGMGDAYTGSLHKVDLQTDTPWNTYMHPGLPPTPISNPGKASLLAAVRPAPGKYLYFVSRGDGSSEFTENLGDHNRAVNKYVRGQ